ncbi:Hypothetical_protein [Hexamita inflata]|uniref:Hypothetical_protein n=1 Tax=Hexamita inflata TaxID=28002 RepID=A0AA86UXV7_9EUKA|nr:Hypothetical protein HINF_LOCUS63945 [Hexamita inflata]
MFVKVNELLQKELQKIVDSKQTEIIQDPTIFSQNQVKETQVVFQSHKQLSEQYKEYIIQQVEQVKSNLPNEMMVYYLAKQKLMEQSKEEFCKNIKNHKVMYQQDTRFLKSLVQIMAQLN